MNRKYPVKLFVLGIIMNFLIHFFPLFALGALMFLIGIWIPVCTRVGGVLFLLDLILSIVEQVRIRKAALSESSNPEYNEMMDALLGPEGGREKLQEIIAAKADATGSSRERYEAELAQRRETLQTLVVYRSLRESVRDGMTLEEMIDAFARMCRISVGDPDDLLFEAGTYNFTGEKLFCFSLVRQFQFDDDDEYVQLHLDVCYRPGARNFGLKETHWGSAQEGGFFPHVLGSPAYHAVKEMPIVKVNVYIDET